MNKYQIIYADPPWKWYSGEKPDGRNVCNKYQTMAIAEISKLNIPSIASEDSVLFMWTTFPLLLKAITVISAWGFVYKTNAFTWIKQNKKSDSLFWGMGYYTRSNAEVCLLATRGKPLKRVSHSVHSVIQHPIMEHSEKPPIIRNKIVELFGDLPRIELFARKPKELFEDPSWKGWDVWGNEVESDIEL